MKTSLSVWSCHKYLFDKSWTNADFIDFAASTGAQGVELLSVFWNEETDIPAVRDALARTGIQLACFGACNNLVQTDAAAREAQVQDILRSVDMAVEFGARVVRVFAGDKRDGISYEQAKGWIVDGLKQGADYAESKGVTLCLENHGIFAGRGDQVVELIEAVGSSALRSTFDMGNFLLVDEQPVEALNQVTAYIHHVHAKDFRKVGPEETEGVYRSIAGDPYVGTVPTEGDVPAAVLVGKLAETGYDGWLSVEYEGLEEQRSGSERAVRIINQLVHSQG
ncbi:sugar phosphate isomerase/epimerase family protein [Paenibacillus sepulcri]|uniref:Sugar phosphate isomerase/epimerase n=1 Tax=Paenibacillus sepulcri TaxID=359917 RepID=A0ABS7CB87_9BACL|nr:sugar phosphate isomerase/epimerase [Paenibacillus sepulcri]